MEYWTEDLTGERRDRSMTSVQATYRAGPASSELIDLTRPSTPGFVRRFGWAVALVAAGAGLLGFVIGGSSEPGYTATAYVELSPETPAEAAAVRELLRSPEVRAAVATELGTTVGRLRPISVVAGPEADAVGVEVSGRNRDRVQTIAIVAAGAAADLRSQEVSVAHDVVNGEVRRLGLEPVRTAMVGAGTGFVLALCVLFVLAYLGLLDRPSVLIPSPGTSTSAAERL